MKNAQESSQKFLKQVEQTSQFQESLTPTLLKVNEPTYESILDLHNAIQKDNVLNIALTGPYGSGKSSVLHTLMSLKNEKWSYLPISLATLDDSKHEKKKDEEDHINWVCEEQNNENCKERLNRRIEYSIIQLLIYR